MSNSKKTKWDWIVYVTSAASQLALAYELFSMCRKEDGSSFSWPFIVVAVAGSVLGLVYSIKNSLTAFMIANIIDVILVIVLVIVKIVYPGGKN